MRGSGLHACARRLRPPLGTVMRPEHCIAPNVPDRQFEAADSNKKCVADFTYIRAGEGWLYLAVVIDLFSSRAVGWSMSTRITAQFVLDALMMAVWRRGKPKALLHHSDQCSQYSSEEFQRLLAEQNITCSMSRRGDCWDNAAMESFFSTLKLERVNRRRYATWDEARADLFDYIARLYNPRRKHSTLGNISPAEFERRFGSQVEVSGKWVKPTTVLLHHAHRAFSNFERKTI